VACLDDCLLIAYRVFFQLGGLRQQPEVILLWIRTMGHRAKCASLLALLCLFYSLTLFPLDDLLGSKKMNNFQWKEVPAFQNTPSSLMSPVRGPGECCFFHVSQDDTVGRFTPEFFEDQRQRGKAVWDPYEQVLKRSNVSDAYEQWSKHLSPKVFDNNATLSKESDPCEQAWLLLILNQANGFYLVELFKTLVTSKVFSSLPYQKETPGLPRILLLGDSISRGIWVRTQALFSPLGIANIQGAPVNCGGFALYNSSLSTWLGDCSWDLVQFNVGMHFYPNQHHGTWQAEYASEIKKIVERIKEHSPRTKIVFASTTPSPKDSAATFPNETSCKNFNLFHKEGVVPTLNEFASSLTKELGIYYNDRYSVIHPVLGDYQKPCDVHYTDEGYDLMATNDWALFVRLLGL